MSEEVISNFQNQQPAPVTEVQDDIAPHVNEASNDLMKRIVEASVEYGWQFKNSEIYAEIIGLSPIERADACEKIAMWYLINESDFPHSTDHRSPYRGIRQALRSAMDGCIRRKAVWKEKQLSAVLTYLIDDGYPHGQLGSNFVKAIEGFAADSTLSPELVGQIIQLCTEWGRWASNANVKRLVHRLQSVIGSESDLYLYRRASQLINPEEAWSDQALADIALLDHTKQEAWSKLLEHCVLTSASKPSKAWLKSAAAYVSEIGVDQFEARIIQWFYLIDKPRTRAITEVSPYGADPNLLLDDANVDLLKGMVWCCVHTENQDIVRAIGFVTQSAYRKVRQKGPRAVRLGNACVWTLGQIPTLDAVGQLAMLKVKTKFGTALKGIEKALNSSAEKLNIPRDEIEEMAVPSYGLEQVGELSIPFADYQAKIVISGSSAEIQWFQPTGKQQKSIPKFVRIDHADELKALKQQLKDIQKMLPAQKARIESQYLKEAVWQFPSWLERYHNHPLVGTIARRLIWQFKTGETTVSGIWQGEHFLDSAESSITHFDDTTSVSLWHPLDETDLEIIQQWRQLLEKLQIQQPFKQAHREIYLLTDAERNTNTYSNRFAAHVLRQHQFNALCAARGWNNRLRLMVDDDYLPAHLELPQWNLRAEFWIEGAGDNYGVDTTDSGSYLYLTTDQVRFYAYGARQNSAHASGGGYQMWLRNGETPDEPLPLEQIPSLVLSEVLRDVDLFVGVASVGNNPEWQDGGPEGRYQTYWECYSFGDLSVSAETRKQALQRIVPRLKIADRCHIAGRFLHVRGDIRSYKIHFGSGNILMEPNDQYLCIVPGQTTKTSRQSGKLHLPFEGDRTLAIILSKALLLAGDSKITDPTITNQIAGNR